MPTAHFCAGIYLENFFGGGGGIQVVWTVWEEPKDFTKRVHGEMYNRPISYQNALFEFW